VHQPARWLDAGDVGAQYADLARAVLRGMARVIDEFFRRPWVRRPDAALYCGHGVLGARRLDRASDLDMIVRLRFRESKALTESGRLPSRCITHA